MKWLFFAIGIGASFVLGYRFEPAMRYQLTGIPAPSDEKASEVAKNPDTPAPAPPPAPPTTPPPADPNLPKIDVAALSKEQLPERVVLKMEAEVGDAASGLKMKIPSGSRVTLVRIENGAVIVSPGAGPFEGSVPVNGTDLIEQLAANPPKPADTTVAENDPAPADPAPTPDPAPTTPDPEPVAQNETPMEEEAPPAAPTAPPAAPADVVAVMQESIKSGQIKEFTFDQVLGWKAEADEVVDGESYQTGVAAYKAETIFGVKTIQAKALIQGGKVIRWIWPKSGMEIK
jgi:hypothetical protein